jgi:uncharacterized protein (DUF433 family)
MARHEAFETTEHARVTLDPDVCNGRPTLRGTRITVASILDYLAAGDTPEDILKEFPSLERADIQAALNFASEVMRHRYHVVAAP